MVSEEQITNGKTLYQQSCALCHGQNIASVAFTPNNVETLTGMINNALINQPLMASLRGVYTSEQVRLIAMAMVAEKYPATSPTPSAPSTESRPLAGRCEGVTSKIAGKTNYRRLNRREFTYAVQDLFFDSSLQVSDFAVDYFSPEGYDNVDGILTTSLINSEKIIAAAEGIASQVVSKPGFNYCQTSVNAFSLIEAESFSENQGGQVETTAVGKNLGYLTDGSFFRYPNVNFGSGANSAHLMVSTEADQAGMRIEVRIDSLSGPILGTLTMQSTGGWYNFVRQAININQVSGQHDVYLIIRAPANTSGNIDAFTFSPGTAASAPTIATAEAPPDQRACIERYLLQLANRAFRRPVALAEIAALVDVAVSASATPLDGVRDAITGILISPRFLVHVVDYSKNVVDGVHTLDQHELAARIALMLWQSIPDDELRRAADSGQLNSSAAVLAQVRRMMTNSKFSRFTSAFPGLWLELVNLQKATLPADLYPEFTAQFKSSALREVQETIGQIIVNNAPADDLFSGGYTYVDQQLAQFYGLSPVATTAGFQRVNLDTTTRRGILTQAAVMAATATTGSNKTIRRGVVMLKKVLCQELGEPPAAVPPIPAPMPGEVVSIRDALEAHRRLETCNSCHKHIDPIGLAYENFSSSGRFLTSQNNRPIDASGVTGDGTNFTNAASLALWLAQDDKSEVCVAKNLTSFGVGRTLASEEECNAANVVKEIRAGSGTVTLRQLIEGVIQSDYFKKSKIP